MLGNKEKTSFGSSNTTTLISRDAEVIGDIKFSGSLDIEGVVKGNIIAQSGGKDAVVRIVDKGRVEGEIRAPSVIVNGAIIGDVHSTKHLELASKARVQGNVHYTLVEMAIGAEVNGGFKHIAGKSSREKEPAKTSHDQIPSIGDAPAVGVQEGIAPAKS
jgi:cytoskeletal protein CcmA (bactofilin family)